MKYILIPIYILFTTLGLTLLKLGFKNGYHFSFLNAEFSLKVHYLTIAGVICYLISFLLYMLVVSQFNLSYIITVVSGFVYIILLYVSIVVFKEQLSIVQIIGTVLIFVGILLMNLPKKL